MVRLSTTALALLAASIASTATAEGLSFGVDFALGAWANHSAAAGLANKEDRVTGKLGISVANDFGMFIGQLDLNLQTITRPADLAEEDTFEEDATHGLADVTLRAMRDFGGTNVGLFLGKGEHDDFGDSDQYMSYQFVGLDAERETGFGAVFGQIGYLDSTDEYSEGLQRATFLRAGAAYRVASGLALTGAFSMAEGRAYGRDASSSSVLGIEFGVEKALGDSGMTLYGSYEHTKLSIEDYTGDTGDEFGTLWVGLKYDFGGNTKRGSKLPNIGQWVAYQANEVE